MHSYDLTSYFYYIRITKREELSPHRGCPLYFTLEWVKLVPTYHWYTHYNTYLNHGRIQDFCLGARSSEGTSYRGPVGQIGVGFREGVSIPSPTGEGSGEGAVPLPRWLGGLLVERRTSVSQIRGSTPGQALPCKNLGQVSHT